MEKCEYCMNYDGECCIIYGYYIEDIEEEDCIYYE